MQRFPEYLLAGYRSFMAGRYTAERDRYVELADHGQQPHTLLIACCDSRAAPEIIFNSSPGELFVVRNVANLIPPYAPDGSHHATSAAIEYAIQVLKVANVVIMGHGRCGGIQAALSPSFTPLSDGDFIGDWMGLLKPAAEQIQTSSLLTAGERQTALERVSIRNSVNNLRSFPFVREREKAGEVHIHGAWFDISSGELWVMDGDSGDFIRPQV
ncbi:carbonic anhydrase [Allorhizobium borbori]|uniref:Carbonic anhydrase n=1 Tax=Allorhizobium borbori TaxID=485907 RepID=A0A7W6P2S0_9HYPH|nr:carbonic anhydrase [Allorhizobium borbori]MBB4104124.1 carbonic anhydrase [Allorhizobium borbori]PZU21540.1 MAG: carbonate dehydratase [Shinella sp.]